MQKFLFTSESVTEGHPDKICDQISDAVLDAIIAQDKNCRVACETAITTGVAVVMGEISTSCYVDIPKITKYFSFKGAVETNTFVKYSNISCKTV